MVKCQIVKSIKVLIIFNAAHRASECSAAEDYTGTAAIESEAARVGATNRTTPIAAEGPRIDERTIAVVAEACHRQFKRRSKSSCTIIITAPT